MKKSYFNNFRTVSIIIPALNEELGIQKTISMIPIKELLKAGYKTEVIVVDNNSTDNTVMIAKNMQVKVLFEEKQGYGWAYMRGFSGAIGQIIVAADADCTYPLNQLPDLLRIYENKKLRFLTTNRFSSGYVHLDTMSLLSKVGNYILSGIFRIIYFVDINDSQSGMWIVNRKLLNRMKLRGRQMNFSQEIKIEAIHYLKTRWDEIDIKYSERLGSSKLSYIKNGIENFIFLFEKRLRR